ncbi:MAG: radical SAM protein, partial [Deltaproteobacteria bacterium]
GYRIAQKFRDRGVPVVLGGIHPTMMPQEAGRYADAVVRGEAESTWPQVLADVKSDRLKAQYVAGGFHSLAHLPMPRRDLLNRKAYFFIKTVQTTRGCPFDCEFCSVTAFYGRTYRTRPVADVVREIESMGGGHNYFVDDNIIGRPDYAKKLFQALKPMKIKWFSQASLNITKDRDLLRLAAESGCGGLFIGFESLSQDTLKSLGKSPNSVKQYQAAVKAIHDQGIGIQGSFIFGADTDDHSVFSNVLRFTEKAHIEAAIFSVLTPFPGTKIFNKLQTENRILHHNWELYDMNHVVFKPRKMTPAQLQDGLIWAYRRLYGYPGIIKRLFPFKRGPIFFGVQNIGFRQAWQKTDIHF